MRILVRSARRGRRRRGARFLLPLRSCHGVKFVGASSLFLIASTHTDRLGKNFASNMDEVNRRQQFGTSTTKCGSLYEKPEKVQCSYWSLERSGERLIVALRKRAAHLWRPDFPRRRQQMARRRAGRRHREQRMVPEGRPLRFQARQSEVR